MPDPNSETFPNFPIDTFRHRFAAIAGFPPYPWQCKLYTDLLPPGNLWGRSITAPTGAGKTSVMLVWLLALLAEIENYGRPQLPRRLVWVVNRRVVVDQATDEAIQIRDKLAQIAQLSQLLTSISTTPGLAISTLRGELADNREWSRDPSRPAIIILTIPPNSAHYKT